ncbi:MAG: hypothetical protein OQL19_16270 [Gammaproteobacteria bacterium]|nr:hypothetical protein [Gammaproteobacteria bacterium]
MFNLTSFSITFFAFFITMGFSSSYLFAQELEDDLTDPTRPAVRISENVMDNENHQTNSVFKVSQIYISKKNQIAIVNGQKVKMGDSVDGAEVLTIQSDSVHLLVEGSITKINIMPSIKQYKN